MPDTPPHEREPGTSTANGAGEGQGTSLTPEPADGQILACELVEDIEVLDGERWLIDSIYPASGCGILGAAPKSGKTWAAISLAVAVASGKPVFGRFAVKSPGPVVAFPAEDGPRSFKERVEAVAKAQGFSSKGLPLHVITESTLMLDEKDDQCKLERLLDKLRPRLLILDPLVRLHSGSENDSGHISRLLGFLRSLQRKFDTGVLLTHHISKRGASVQPGQALRGSGDLFAWIDTGLYLQKQIDGSTVLTIEHRSAPAPEPLVLKLVSESEGATHFRIQDASSEDGGGGTAQVPIAAASAKTQRAEPPLESRIVALLRSSPTPLSQVKIRNALEVRNKTLTIALRGLQQSGAISNLGRMQGWVCGAQEAEGQARS